MFDAGVLFAHAFGTVISSIKFIKKSAEHDTFLRFNSLSFFLRKHARQRALASLFNFSNFSDKNGKMGFSSQLFNWYLL